MCVMKNIKPSKRKSIWNTTYTQMERGDGGISYAMYFIAIVTVLILYMFFKLNSDLYVAEEVLENGLHIAENKILTINQTGLGADEYSLENELRRFHIVTSYSTDNGLSPQEIAQLKNIATEFSSTLQTQYELDGASPKSGILKDLCAEGSTVRIDNPKGTSTSCVYIYEPVYKRTITVEDDGMISSDKLGSSKIKKFSFDSKYEIINWITYTLSFDENNTYVNATKSVSTTQPKLQNGDDVIGATIEATVRLQIAGVNNVFDMTGSNGNAALFTSNPQREIYDVTVTQSADIVISTNDTRDAHTLGG